MRQETCEDIRSPKSKNEPQDATYHGEQKAFGECLAGQTDSTSAQGQTHSHLSLACRNARQQEISNIGTGNEQNQPHHGHQNQQWL